MSNLNNGTGNTNESKEEVVVKDIFIENEDRAKFDELGSFSRISSVDLTQIISDFFGSVYEDFYGARIECAPGTNIPTISLFFDRKDHAEDAITAMKRIGAKTASTFDKLKFVSNNLSNGDTFAISENGKSGLAKFISYRSNARKSDGSIEWKRLVSLYSEPNTYGMAPQQFMCVRWIDPDTVLNSIFPTKNEDGETYFYHLESISSMDPRTQSVNPNFAAFNCTIVRTNDTNVKSLAAKFGYVNNSIICKRS